MLTTRSFFENKFENQHHKKFIYFFFVFSCLLLGLTYGHPPGDFGNYYYGSKLFLQGIDPLKFYQSIHFFNSEIGKYETADFFENYGPVPPFSLIFYIPFTFFKLSTAKFLFSLLSMTFFCWALKRLIEASKNFSLLFYFLPLIFLQPLFSNFHQGQAYLLITALLFEFYIALQQDKKLKMGWIVALLFCLKIFPAFIAIIFIFKKDRKALVYTISFTLGLILLTAIITGFNTIMYYYFEIFPRLAMNDVTAPFYYFNQSIHTFLLNCFVAHPYLNPSPIIDLPWLAVMLQLIFYSFIFSVFIKVILKKSAIISFIITILVLVLINKYSTVYSLIILSPFVFILKDLSVKKACLVVILFFLACNIPTYKLESMPLLIQYLRVWLLCILFVVLMKEFKFDFDTKIFAICLIIFILPSLSFFRYQAHAKEVRAANGIIYDFEVEKNRIKLYTCRGKRDSVEYIKFVSDKIAAATLKMNAHNTKAIYVNDKELISLSDKNAGFGLYYLKIEDAQSIDH